LSRDTGEKRDIIVLYARTACGFREKGYTFPAEYGNKNRLFARHPADRDGTKTELLK
jgi:hypothetical protein